MATLRRDVDHQKPKKRDAFAVHLHVVLHDPNTIRSIVNRDSIITQSFYGGGGESPNVYAHIIFGYFDFFRSIDPEFRFPGVG